MIAKAVAVFRAANGKRAFAFLRGDGFFGDGELLFSEDGTKFYALKMDGAGTSLAGIVVEADLSFTSPRQEISGKLFYKSDIGVVVYDEDFYTREEGEEFEVEVIPLPLARRAEYLFRKKDGALIYVSSDKYNYSYESFKLFVGDGKTMREIPVQDVCRYRDGGTTYVKTGVGTLFSPSPMKSDPEVFPRWEEGEEQQELIRLEPKDCDIVETPDGQVFITTH